MYSVCGICGASWVCEHAGRSDRLVDGGSYEDYLETTDHDQAQPFDPYGNALHARAAAVYDPEFDRQDYGAFTGVLDRSRKRTRRHPFAGQPASGIVIDDPPTVTFDLDNIRATLESLRTMGRTMEEATKAFSSVAVGFRRAFEGFYERVRTIVDLILGRKRLRRPGPPAPAPRRQFWSVSWPHVVIDDRVPWIRAPPL